MFLSFARRRYNSSLFEKAQLIVGTNTRAFHVPPNLATRACVCVCVVVGELSDDRQRERERTVVMRCAPVSAESSLLLSTQRRRIVVLLNWSNLRTKRYNYHTSTHSMRTQYDDDSKAYNISENCFVVC